MHKSPADEPVRIAFLVNHYPVVSEVFIMHAAAGLARRGYHVDIVPIYGLSGAAGDPHEIERELAADPRIRIVAPAYNDRRSRRWLAAPAALWRVFRRCGRAATTRLLRERRFGDAGRVRALNVVDALASSGPHDIIHCQFASLAPLAVSLRNAGLLTGRIVVHFRGYDITQYVGEHGADVYDDVFAQADWFIANCAAFGDRAAALGCDRDRMSVVSSGTDLTRFAFAQRHWTPGEPLRILGIGRLVEKKGFETLISAIAQLFANGMNVTLTIIGEGPLRVELAEQVANAGLAGRVELAGALPHHEIATRLRASHIFVAASQTAPNGDTDAPVNTIKEAMATGTPVIGSNHGGIPEIVVEGVNGMVFDEGDAAALAQRIRDLANEPGNWAAMGRAGRRTIEEHHSLDISTQGFLSAYRQAGLVREPQMEQTP